MSRGRGRRCAELADRHDGERREFGISAARHDGEWRRGEPAPPAPVLGRRRVMTANGRANQHRRHRPHDPARTRTCAISIDLDGIACYYRIHGLGPPPVELEHAILERAWPRAAKLFAARGIRVTWFVVGRDADGELAVPDRAARAANAQRLRALAERGDELGNHSYSHPYELARMSPAEVDAELDGCDRVLRRIAGAPTRGFRAPGYDLSLPMLDHLARRGYRYDSSLFLFLIHMSV